MANRGIHRRALKSILEYELYLQKEHAIGHSEVIRIASEALGFGRHPLVLESLESEGIGVEKAHDESAHAC